MTTEHQVRVFLNDQQREAAQRLALLWDVEEDVLPGTTSIDEVLIGIAQYAVNQRLDEE